MKIQNNTKVTLAILFLATSFSGFAQVTLKADGLGDTYELINSVFAPGYDAVENPECAHADFGRHITEIWDSDLKENVFKFYIHVTPDNDRCENFDRQRVEIKTFESSPDNLKGALGETITYKWKFKLPTGFQPSTNFTHLHQIKAVGGSESIPIFSLSAKKGKTNKMNLVHDNVNILASANLSDFENTWVEITEVIKVGANGTYSMTIKKIDDGTVVLSYSNANIMTIRPDNNFIRPKWGIYRSLKNPEELRDESVRFADFSITEGAVSNK
ncbi:T9SS type A sorting domain-containing protein [Flavobacterium sp. WC2509]|uniref:T9SS type A sorting domain-containing protein n=1 Tax=Flavobacterium sp. WC2509 TaxID=3461406 RepID=UPI004043BD49